MDSLQKFDGHLKSFDDADLLAFEIPGFITSIISGAQAVTSKVLQTGEKLGLPMPLDNDITMLRTQRDDLKKMSLRADSELRMNVSKWQASSDLALKRLADALAQQGAQAVSKQAVTNTYYADAIIAAQNLQAALTGGKDSAQLSAAYAVKKKLATDNGAATQQAFDNFFNGVYKAIEQSKGFQGYLTELNVSPSAIADQAKSVLTNIGVQAKELPTALKVGVPVVLGLLALNFFAPTLALLKRR